MADGDDGSDIIIVGTGIAADVTLDGGDGDYADRLDYAGSGNARLVGDAGDDYLAGGTGKNFLYGGRGDDHLLGGAGTNYLYGGGDDDYLVGGTGTNELNQLDGSRGNDTLIGGAGDNNLKGGPGSDRLVAGPNGDDLYGGGGDDTLVAGTGSDNIFGEGGQDFISWTANNDSQASVMIDGGSGNNVLHVFGSDGFTIRFDPSALGIRNAAVRIANDDSDEAPFEFAIQGTGIKAEVVQIGPENSGISVQDGATGSGFVMYSAENVHSRFSDNAPHAYNSDHLIAVRYLTGP